MTPTVTVNGLKLVGVELISSESPSFDSTVMSLLPTRTATVALDFKPKKRVVGQDFVIGPSREEEYYLKQFRSWAKTQKQEVPAMEKIEIDVDAAIFSDGLLVGPNRTNFDQDFIAYFEAKQKLFRQIVSDLDSGRDIDEAFARRSSLRGL